MISDDDLSKQSQDLIQRLREQGHHGPARRLAASVEDGALMVLRETLETVLTAIEAIDPVTETMMERLRISLEGHLRLPREGGKTG
jgi:hypothetical protein